jgi:quercetin dioxygenase-like cupin family protein
MRALSAFVALAMLGPVAALGAGCGPKPVNRLPPDRTDPPAQSSAAQAPADARTPSDDERLAAIQKAMNELDEGAQACWAMAATERLDIEGAVEANIDIATTTAKVEILDKTGSPKLVGCMRQLLERYPWAPPLHGQSIRLPFKFTAPDGQSVIDRRLVEANGQGKLSVAVLLDEANTGNPGASMFELAIGAGGSTGWRKAERAEVWYFLGDARINNPVTMKQPTRSVSAGDMMYIPAGGARAVSAADQDVHAVVVVVPGQREGSARAGALPTQEVAPSKTPPLVLPATAAKTYGPATIYVEPATVKGAPFSASVLQLAAGAKVPEHVHAHETELLYILEGSGTMTIAGQDVAVTPTSVIQIPPNTKHAFAADTNLRAFQVYTPAGPEQRFKQKPTK